MKSIFRTAISETVGALALLLLANWLGWKSQLGFYRIEPNPMCVVVLLMAARYGSFAGFFSAGCSGLVLGIAITVQSGQNAFYDPYVIKYSFLFFLIGYVIGEIRQKYIRYEKRLEGSIEKQRTVYQELEEEKRRVERINKEMESRILDDVSSFASLYETTKHLQSFDLEHIYQAVLDILVQYLEVEACSLFLLEGDNLILKQSRGGEQVETIPIMFDDGIIARCVKQKHAMSIKDMLIAGNDYAFSLNESIMAAPLVTASGDVLGAISIERLPFMRITGSSMKIFSMLAEWVSSDIENALYFQEVKKKNILDEVLNIYTYDYLIHRLMQEFHRAERYKIPLSVVLIQVKELEKMDLLKQSKILKFLAAGLNKCLRLTDIVTQYSDSIPFCIILTTTDYDQSKLAINRILGMFKGIGIDTINNGLPLELEYGIGSYGSSLKSHEQLMENAEKDMKKCAASLRLSN